MKDKVAYALGTSIGLQLQQMGANELDITDFSQGVKDALAGSPVMERAEIEAVINEFFTRKSQEQAAKAKEEGARYIPICAKTEEDIADYSPEEKKAFLAEMGIEASGLDNLITASYDLLGLISFLTDGKKECRAWTIRKGTKAPQAAGKIHSDFERGFIRAEVIAFDDLKACGTLANAKAKGLLRSEGKEYVMNDGDVVLFRFNV